MASNTLVKPLFQVPDQIRKGDFVVKLTEGITTPRATAETFVITPEIEGAFDKALRLIGNALSAGRSHAAYVHGSFGSGKSHFMALLSLALEGAEAAWRKPELHPLREKHDFVGKAKLLKLHYHMVGQDSIEAAVFSGYVDHVLSNTPSAPVPPLFADEELFTNAAALLDTMGEETFFSHLNAGLPAVEGWGDHGAAARWTKDRFHSVVASSDPEVRGKLFDALTRTSWYTSYIGNRQAFLDFDSGLAAMAAHAKGLGYDGIVLFLDELILWLAHRSADATWLQNEAQKMVKLVEAQDQRVIPLTSFIARQRDLAEMVGEQYAGIENRNLRDFLKHWEDRFDRIELGDRNLPAIVEKRVLIPKDDAARSALDAAFAGMRKSTGAAWQTLLGQGDGDAFRKFYPFSPVLVETLVALSGSLQRERTAIKLLMEMLFEHIDDLSMGEVVRVGDLFDLLAGGEDTADGMMRSRFESAKHIYRYQLLPLIQQNNQTDSADRCRRFRDDHPTRLGCSGCPEKQCRTHNRIAKTLLIAALVPEVAALKDLTTSRLVALNFGTLKTPVPGTEAGVVAGILRDWAGHVSQLRIGQGTDPSVTVQLEGVDIGPILDQAREADSRGARQRVVRDLLFESIGLEKGEPTREKVIDWRMTSRPGLIKFGNVRRMSDEQIRCPEEMDWQIVIDYPFDDDGFGPNDDVTRLEEITENSVGTWTMAWLPSFFSDTTNTMLGDLVVLDHILETRESKQRYVQHLSVEQQTRAVSDLENLRSAKMTLLLQAMEQAFGLRTVGAGVLDPSQTLDTHLYLLKPGVQLQQNLAPSMTSAIPNFAGGLLDTRYPRHPQLGKKLTNATVQKVLGWFGEMVDAETKHIDVDRSTAEMLHGTLGALGIVRVKEASAHVDDDRMLQEIEKKRQQTVTDHPTAETLCRWVDENRRMGMQKNAEDLVIRAYARWSARAFTLDGRPYEPQAGKPIPDRTVLEKPELPSPEKWKKALDAAGALFGIAVAGKALHAENLQRLHTAVMDAVGKRNGAVSKLPPLIGKWLGALDLSENADRLLTARSADSLYAAIENQPPINVIEKLAEFNAETSPRALGTSAANSPETVRVLEDDLVLGPLLALKDRQNRLGGAIELLDQVRNALRQDEININLAGRLRELANGAYKLMTPAPTSTTPAPPTGGGTTNTLRKQKAGVPRAKLQDTVTALVAEVEQDIENDADIESVEISLEIHVRRRS